MNKIINNPGDYIILGLKVEEMLRTARADGNAEQEAKILQAIKDGFKLPDKPSEASTAEFFKVNDRASLTHLLNRPQTI